MVIIDYGFNLQIVRDVAVKPDNALSRIPRALNGKLILSLVSTIILYITCALIDYPEKTRFLIWTLWSASLFYSVGLFFNSIFRGLSRFEYEAYPTILLNVIQFSLVGIFLLTNHTTIAIAVAYLVSRFIYFLFSLHLIRSRVGKFSFSIRISEGIAALKDSLSFGIHTILAVLYFQIDTVFLSYFKGNQDVGWYQAAMRILLASLIFSDIITTIFFPIIARNFAVDREELRKVALACNKYLFIIGGYISLCFLLFAKFLIQLFYGKGYGESILIMQILSAVVFLRFSSSAYAMLITVSNNQRLRALGVAVSLVVNILLNLVLIPRYGAAGAAVASMLTHLILFALYSFYSYRVVGTALISRHCRFGIGGLLLLYPLCTAVSRFSLVASMAIFAVFAVALATVSLDNAEKHNLRGIIYQFTTKLFTL